METIPTSIQVEPDYPSGRKQIALLKTLILSCGTRLGITTFLAQKIGLLCPLPILGLR